MELMSSLPENRHDVSGRGGSMEESKGWAKGRGGENGELSQLG